MSGLDLYSLFVGLFVTGVILAILWPDIIHARAYARRQRERHRGRS